MRLKYDKKIKAFYEDLYVHQHVPFCIERTRDKAILLMNNDFKTYSFTYNYMIGKWSYQKLSNEDFKVISWAPIENLFNHPEKYFKEFQIISNYRVELTKNDKNNKKIKFVKNKTLQR